MNVFQWLENWFKENNQSLSKRNVKFEFSLKTQTDNPAQYVDMDTTLRMARITLWETGNCVFEILENETGKNVFEENKIIRSREELNKILNKGFSQL